MGYISFFIITFVDGLLHGHSFFGIYLLAHKYINKVGISCFIVKRFTKKKRPLESIRYLVLHLFLYFWVSMIT